MRAVIVLVLVVTARVAAAQPAPGPDPPRRWEFAAQAGVGVAGDPDVDNTGAGLAIDLEAGRRYRRVTVAAFATYYHFHTGAEPDTGDPTAVNLRGNAFGLGARIHVHLGPVFVGCGLAFEYWRTGGPEILYDGYGGSTPDGTFSDNFVVPELEIHAGYTFPRIGRVAPQVMAMLMTLPVEQPPLVLSWRIVAGVQF
jgi:hypothetical protein